MRQGAFLLHRYGPRFLPLSPDAEETAETHCYPPGGYAVLTPTAIFVPAFMGKLRPLLAWLRSLTDVRLVTFTAILNPKKLRHHLRNVRREWDEWLPDEEAHSHCLQIELDERL